MQTGELTLQMALIVAVGVFLASFTDAIAGGGGIISVPTYLIAGLPAHYALGTNKLSAGLGSLASTGRYIKNGYVEKKALLPCITAGLVCAALCAWAATGLEADLLRKLFGGFLVLIGLRELLGRGQGQEKGEPGA